MLKALILISLLCFGISLQKSVKTWILDSESGSEIDKSLLASISSLAYKQVLTQATTATREIQKVQEETKEIEKTIQEWKALLEKTNKSMTENSESCNSQISGSTSCYQCYTGVCYQEINHCDLSAIIESAMKNIDDSVKVKPDKASKKPDKSSSSAERDAPQKQRSLDEILEADSARLTRIENQMADQDTPMGNFKFLFEDMEDDFESFEDDIMLDVDLVDSSNIFMEDISLLAGDSSSAFIDGSKAAMDSVDESFDDMKILWDDLNLSMDFMSVEQERMSDIVEKTVSSADDAAKYGMNKAKQTLDEHDEALEDGVKVANAGAHAAVDAVKRGIKKLKFPWKRSTDEDSEKADELCESFISQGEFKFCKQYEEHKDCAEQCELEKSKSVFCAEAIIMAQQLNDVIGKLGKYIELKQKLAADCLREYAWVKVLLETMSFKNQFRDEKQLVINSIETDPSKYDKEQAWLFKDVYVDFTLKQKGSNYIVGEKRTKIEESSNLMNIYWKDSAIPLANVVIKAMNETLQKDTIF